MLDVRRLGRVPYAEALELQRSLVDERRAGRITDTLLLVEHPHVLTLGVRGDGGRSHILATPDTLAARGVDVHRYVRDLEDVLMRTAGDYGVSAHRVDGLTGVWVGQEKLAAIGVRIARWITSHGFAFNVSTDLDYFGLIVPCGIADRGVTSLERLTGRTVELPAVQDRIVLHFSNVFSAQALP